MAVFPRKARFRSVRSAQRTAEKRARERKRRRRVAPRISREAWSVLRNAAFLTLFAAVLVRGISNWGLFSEGVGAVADKYGRGLRPGGFPEVFLSVGTLVIARELFLAVRKWRAMRRRTGDQRQI